MYFFLSYYFQIIQKQCLHKNHSAYCNFSFLIIDRLIYIFLSLGMMTRREFREYFYLVFYDGLKDGQHSDNSCLTVQSFMCPSSVETRHKLGIWTYVKLKLNEYKNITIF